MCVRVCGVVYACTLGLAAVYVYTMYTVSVFYILLYIYIAYACVLAARGTWYYYIATHMPNPHNTLH